MPHAPILTLLALFSCSVLACSETESIALDKVTQKIKNSASSRNYSDLDISFPEAICKKWPSLDNTSIIVRPYSYAKTNEKVEEIYLAAVIAVIDTDTGKIKSIINDEKTTTIDAVSPDRISIDTARYRISNRDLAFGVRFLLQNQSRISPFQEEFLNLYVPSGSGIRPVARGLKTSTYSGEGNGDCLFEGTESSSTIAIGKTITNQKIDLKITTTSTRISSKEENTECVVSETKNSTIHITVKYNGEQYEFPREIRSSLAL